MPDADPNPLLAAALGYAARGWRVVPLHHPKPLRDGHSVVCSCGKSDCRSQGKHPRHSRWTELASTVPETIRRWWRDWPAGNVGVAAGVGSGVVLVDVDGVAGERALAELAGDDQPATCECVTGNGRRLVYTIPAGLPVPPATKVVECGDGGEVRCQGDGGQGVMPPSLHPSLRHYAWAAERSPADLDPAPMPSWLVAVMCVPSEAAVADGGAADVQGAPGSDFNRRADWWADVIEPAAGRPAGAVGGVLRFTRPGKAGGVSATVGHYRARDGSPALFVFTNNWPGLSGWKCYDKFGAYARLFHGGDYSAAARTLREKGYGDAPSARWNGRPATNGRHQETSVDRPPAEVRSPEPVRWVGPPLPLPTLPPASGFPLDTLPPAVARFFCVGAVSLNVPVDYLAVPGLAVLGAAVGRSVAVRRSAVHAEVPLLWAAVVGLPGTVKSAALGLVADPLFRAERRWRADHADAAAVWDDERPSRERQLREWREGGGRGDRPPLPPRPALRQVVLDQFTGEALARTLATNPRGLVVVKDELSGTTGQLDKYRNGKGDDKENLLSVWAGRLLKVNRLKDGDAPPLLVPHPFAAVAGMLTPASLARLRGEGIDGEVAGDGWPDRFLWSYPDPLPAVGETWAEVPAELADRYAAEVDRLLARDLVAGRGHGDDPHPQFVGFAPDARPVWEAMTAELAADMNALDPDDPFRGVLSKLRGYALRFLALLWPLWRPEADPQAGLDAELVRHAAALVGYFRSHAGRCWGLNVSDRPARVARRLVRWLERQPTRTAFTWREAFQALKDRRDVLTAESLARPLRLVEDFGYIRPLDVERPERGRPVSESYAVNPQWRRDTPENSPPNPPKIATGGEHYYAN